jgi:plasmid replication initiation protein
MKRLYEKSGSTGTKRKFAFRMRKIVKRDKLPEYALELRKEEDTGAERVWMCRRSLLPETDSRWEPSRWSDQKFLDS